MSKGVSATLQKEPAAPPPSEQNPEQIQQLPLTELHPFPNHPFKVLEDEAMQRTVESIAQYGVLAPLIARPRPEGGYEILSGHRRQYAAKLAGPQNSCPALMSPISATTSGTRLCCSAITRPRS